MENIPREMKGVVIWKIIQIIQCLIFGFVLVMDNKNKILNDPLAVYSLICIFFSIFTLHQFSKLNYHSGRLYDSSTMYQIFFQRFVLLEIPFSFLQIFSLSGFFSMSELCLDKTQPCYHSNPEHTMWLLYAIAAIMIPIANICVQILTFVLSLTLSSFI